MPAKTQKPKSKPADPTEQGLPCSIEAEKAILGAILLDNEKFYEVVADGFEAKMFSLMSHQQLFSAIQERLVDDSQADIITISEQLRQRRQLESTGGVAYIASLTDGIAVRTSIARYGEIVGDFWRRRNLITVCHGIMLDAYDRADTTDDLIAVMSEKILRLQAQNENNFGEMPKNLTDHLLANLRAIASAEHKIVGLTYGLDELDLATTGLRKGEVTVVGGFSGTGKSTLAMMAAVANAQSGVIPVLFTLEMPKDDMLLRMWSGISGVHYPKLRAANSLSMGDFEKLEMTKKFVDALPIYIDDADMEINQLVARAWAYVKQKNAGLIIVDYLQLLRGFSGEKAFDRVTRAAESLRLFAKQSGVPVLEAAQLSKPEGKDPNTRPNRFMLKGTGEIEQAAHCIVLTYMPVDEKTNKPLGKDTLILAKQRNGPLGDIKVRYDPETMAFKPRDDSTEQGTLYESPEAKKERLSKKGKSKAAPDTPLLNSHHGDDAHGNSTD